MYDIKIYESGQEKETIRGLSIAQASTLQKVLDRHDIAHRVKRIEAAQQPATLPPRRRKETTMSELHYTDAEKIARLLAWRDAEQKEIAQLRAAVGRLEGERQALRKALEAVQWEHEYSPDSANANESGFIVRCAFCDVLRDDVQSGADKHTDGCKVAAALAADGKREAG
jgi:hypothetical protein